MKRKRIGLFILSIIVLQFVTRNFSVNHCISNIDDGGNSSQQIITLGHEDKDVFVFVHISDLHISHFTAKDRYEQLNEFCSIDLKAISPGLVLASGDLTDSVAPGNVLVTQFAEEWEMYKALYTKCQNESGVISNNKVLVVRSGTAQHLPVNTAKNPDPL